jgi:hypothetical protein
MAYIEGEGRNQGTLFPVVLDDLVPIAALFSISRFEFWEMKNCLKITIARD